MMRAKKWVVGILAAALAAFVSVPADASSFSRVDLDYLVDENEMIVVGEVVDAQPYWNKPGTLILTDVRLVVSDILKGKPADREITVTLPGGTIGDRMITVVGGAELTPGRSYMLFLRKGDLPGVQGANVVRDHAQGVFEIQMAKGGLRAVSQAQSSRHELLPDAAGHVAPLGGAEGLALETMRKSVRERVERVGRKGEK